jgi:hypothetical protein
VPRGTVGYVAVLVLVLWGLLYRFADGVTFTAAHTLHAATVAIRTATSTDPMQDLATMTNYPWLLGLSAAFQVGVWLVGAVVIWRKWAEVADRPAPWAALASAAWGLWVAGETLTRPWAQGGPGLPTAALVLAILAVATGAVGAHRLARLGRTLFAPPGAGGSGR